MGRPRNRLELRAEAEAAEALGLNSGDDKGRRRPGRSADEPPQLRSKPIAGPKMRVVWAVCDMGGRTVATFDYVDKADAEAKAAELKARGKGAHFVRSVKEPMGSGGGGNR
ncbi:hypothetical protein [Aquisphaera insulae]|uniref:hypothetical protein n=1 Tax=Aquisphaera insulae TaxID=2712864 RepID=UPI0013EBB35A|nr:hypothetical protein [Aquisphaera insulae]